MFGTGRSAGDVDPGNDASGLLPRKKLLDAEVARGLSAIRRTVRLPLPWQSLATDGHDTPWSGLAIKVRGLG